MIVAVVEWLAAVFMGVLPRRLWRRLDALPMRAAALPSALLTLGVGFYAALDGFLTFGRHVADTTNSWMLHQLTHSSRANPYDVALVPYGTSVFTPFGFFLTPLGLASSYLIVSGAVRAISAGFGDPRGDFILTAFDAVASRAYNRAHTRRAHATRTRLEGPDAPDSLRLGKEFDVDADFVLVSARKKPEWTKGAVVMTSTDWYNVGEPFDTNTPLGLRSAYPLTRVDTLEVVRRGIQHELPEVRPEKKKPAKP